MNAFTVTLIVVGVLLALGLVLTWGRQGLGDRRRSREAEEGRVAGFQYGNGKGN